MTGAGGRRGRGALTLGLCLTLAGCGRTPQAVADPPPAAPAPVVATSPSEPQRDLPTPAILKAASLQAWQGDQLDRASMSLAETIGRFEVPKGLAAGIKRLERGVEPAEPSAGVVQKYVMARDAYFGRDLNEALRLINEVIAADPDSAEPRALRARVMLDTAGIGPAQREIDQALRRDADHPDALFVSGRLAFNGRKYDAAAVLFDRLLAVKGRPVDRGVRYIGRYYLGQALLRMGYDAAAIECLDPYVQRTSGFGGSTVFDRQVQSVGRQRGPALLQLGDALVRLGRAREAIDRYDTAAESDRVDASVIASRRMYALLLTEQDEQAERVVIDELLRDGARSESLELVEYTAAHTGDRRRFASALRKAYDQAGDRELLARAVVESLKDPTDAEAFIAADLARHPDHIGVFKALLATLGPEQVDRAITSTLNLIDKAPTRAAAMVEHLLEWPLGRDKWLAAIDRLPAERRDTPAAAYLRAKIEMEDGNVDAANESLENAADFAPAIVMRVDLALLRGKPAEAMALIDQHDADAIPRLRYLRVVSQARQARQAQSKRDAAAARQFRADARQALDTLIAASPTDPELLLMRADLQRGERDFAGAERTLLRLLATDSTYEPAYAALFEIYERQSRDLEKFAQLFNRARVAIPAARITRLKLAQVQRARGQLREAETTLGQLIMEDPRQPQALRELVSMLVATDQADRAQAAMLDVLETDPHSLPALLLLEDVAAQLGNEEVFFERYETYLRGRPDGVNKQVRLAALYARWGKANEQIAALQAALGFEPDGAAPLHRQLALVYADEERFDEAVTEAEHAVKLDAKDVANHAALGQILHAAGRTDEAIATYKKALDDGEAEEPLLREALASLLFSMGRADEAIDELDRVIALAPKRRLDLMYRQAGYASSDPPRAEKLLERILAEDPDHVGANNDLGYSWADAGRNLARAEQMIRRAVAARPQTPAYLDSLGWVLYKKGEFGKARAWLERAYGMRGGKDAVIVDHLGDALWRDGETKAAVEKWKQAKQDLRQVDTDDLRDHEKRLLEALKAKLEAAEAGQLPRLAPVPGSVEEDRPPDLPAAPMQ